MLTKRDDLVLNDSLMESKSSKVFSLYIILTCLIFRIGWKSFMKKFPEKQQSKRHCFNQVESDQLKQLFMFHHSTCVTSHIFCVLLSIDSSTCLLV